MKKFLIYLPNIITISRFFLTALSIMILSEWMAHDYTGVPSVLYLIFGSIYLSDLLDGAVARNLKASSSFGAVLDISADFFYISSSLFVFVLFHVLPVWYAMFVLADFLVFLLTSNYLKQGKHNNAPVTFVFDILGRISAVVFYLVPAAACIAYSHSEILPVLDLVLYSSVLLGGISILNRVTSCIRAKRRTANGLPYIWLYEFKQNHYIS